MLRTGTVSSVHRAADGRVVACLVRVISRICGEYTVTVRPDFGHRPTIVRRAGAEGA